MTLAPFTTCCRANESAVSKSPSLMSFLNLGEPITLVRSPTIASCPVRSPMSCGSKPLKRSEAGRPSGKRGFTSASISMIACKCAGVVPQQPPATFSSP